MALTLNSFLSTKYFLLLMSVIYGIRKCALKPMLLANISLGLWGLTTFYKTAYHNIRADVRCFLTVNLLCKTLAVSFCHFKALKIEITVMARLDFHPSSLHIHSGRRLLFLSTEDSLDGRVLFFPGFFHVPFVYH